MTDTLELALRRAEILPKTLNEADRTVEIVWSTGADVRRQDFDGDFVERLSLDPTHVDLSRLSNGASVLNAHQQRDAENVIGVVLEASVDGHEGRATIRLSARSSVEPILEDIKTGILRHVSVGYSVEEWVESTDPKSGERVRTAVQWTPNELSLVPVPADPGATVRAKEKSMPDTNSGVTLSDRAKLNREIRSIMNIAGLSSAVADELIDNGSTADQARQRAFDELAKRGGGPIQTQTASIITDNEDPAVRAARMGEAVFARINPNHEPSEPSRQYFGHTFRDLAIDCLRRRGESVTALSTGSLVERGLHTTSDFPLIFGDAVGRTLRMAYEAAPQGIKTVAKQANARDFRAKSRIILGEAETLDWVGEGGEFRYGSMPEAAESYRIDTFGKIFAISRQAIVNDDLGAFADPARRFGQAAAEFEAQFLVDLLETGNGAGPVMSDGTTLFQSEHANLAETGGPPTPDAFSTCRKSMRLQKGLSGKPINVVPKYVLVPAELETEAEQALSTVTAAMTQDVNVFANGLTLIVEPRLSDSRRWYVAADPNQVDGLEYAYLEGEPGPQIETRVGFEIDGVQTRVRLDFGAGFVDWRSWFSNSGG